MTAVPMPGFSAAEAPLTAAAERALTGAVPVSSLRERGFSTREVLDPPSQRAQTAAEYIRRVPIEFLLCRDLQHGKEPYDVRDDHPFWIQIVQCPSCGLLKRRFVHKVTGKKTPWKAYNYPKGYLRTGQGRMTEAEKGQLRLTSMGK